MNEYEALLQRLGRFLDRRLYLDALDRMYPPLHKALLEHVDSNRLKDRPTDEAAQSILAYLEHEAKRRLKRFPLDGLLFALMGREVLYQGLESGHLKYWSVSHDVNALNRLAGFASGVPYHPTPTPSMLPLLLAYALAERHAFVEHNLDVCQVSDIQVDVGRLIHEAIEPHDFAQHWEDIAADYRVYEEYEYQSDAGPSIEKKLKHAWDRLTADQNVLMRRYFGFGLEDFALLTVVIGGLAEEGNIVFPVEESGLSKVFAGGISPEAIHAILEAFTWAPHVVPNGSIWHPDFKPMLGLELDGRRWSLVTPRACAGALTSFWNVVKMNAYLQRYLGQRDAEEFARGNEPYRRHHSIELCYKVADALLARGLRLPMLGELPRIDIDKLPSERGAIRVGHPQNLGDLDVVAADLQSREVLVCECKLWRVALSATETVRIDLAKAEEALPKVRARHEWLANHWQLLGNLLGIGNASNYRLRTLVVTARPNFMAARFKDPDVEFVSFGALLRRGSAGSNDGRPA